MALVDMVNLVTVDRRVTVQLCLNCTYVKNFLKINFGVVAQW